MWTVSHYFNLHFPDYCWVGYLFICILSIQVSSSVNCLFISFAHFSFGLLFNLNFQILKGLLVFLIFFPGINTFHITWIGNYFIHAYDYCSFIWICGLVSFIIPGKLSLSFLQILSLIYSSSLLLKLIFAHIYLLLCLHSLIIFCISPSLYATFWMNYYVLFSSLVILSFALLSLLLNTSSWVFKIKYSIFIVFFSYSVDHFM